MLSTMMQQPLLISSLLRHAERHHGEREIVSRRVEGDIHRYDYRAFAARARRLANALAALGVAADQRVATLAWNGYRHMELYYAISGMAAVVHTANPRLHADQLVWMLNDADDQVLFFDLSFLALVEEIAPRLGGVRALVAMTDRAHMPAHSSIAGLLCYEELLEAASDDYDWPVFDEAAASGLCYTSGTTGHPKGVLYSHRSSVLHAFAVALPDAVGCSATDAILPVVPMYHVNAWGLPYAACMVGAKMVFPGPRLDGASLYELFEAEGVTIASGVPTIWQGLLAHVGERGLRFHTLRLTGIGGSACPPSMIREFQERYGVHVMHGWGMTETSPLATTSTLKAHHHDRPADERLALQAKQGRAIFGVDMKVVDARGAELPWDGRSPGELMIRGPWVTSSYFRAGNSPLQDGWFPTGDVATIDADGFMRITDRAKDVIKSGGEWISSIDIECIAVAHPAVALAACVGVPHPKWDERPLLVVVRRPGAQVERDELLRFFDGKVARWWIPDDVVFVDAIPLGPTGKMQKNRLRDTVCPPEKTETP
ncbi:3-(methylthio)propionyl-CoA ligase [Xylophilus sp. GOD-11R]|uniref:3-(methylthio)propionyl-CoA ligase n=1 Tax=Xylophilus sp. GOD-11R TaxID=3089814 RepID=UPI00298C6570|nr:3-(methylthio)propionyl-CoA ligase [Xylophilus sp. GOD-11R]WPB56068.1 3-(methylthio)propionyl-CoA ligase [Xylophilus sp. GOD-11R]